MSDNFEYVFYFLLRRSIFKSDGEEWREPDDDISGSMLFESDKRLFRFDVEQSEQSWQYHYLQKWQELQNIYTDLGDEIGRQYCQQALFGATMLIISPNDNVKQHVVDIDLQDKQQLQFKADKLLCKLEQSGVEQVGKLWNFVLKTQENKPFLDHLQIHTTDSELFLKPTSHAELQPNPVFSVYGLSFGGEINQKLAARLTSAPSNRHPLLSTIFTRSIISQWQFGRIDIESKRLKKQLQANNTKYSNNSQYQADNVHCISTRDLEQQLQEMQTLNNKLVYLNSRIQSANQTLEINSKNFARRLEILRQEDNTWQLDLCGETKQWQEKEEFEITPLLVSYHRGIRRLEYQHNYLDSQIKYLQGLQTKWQLYLSQRQTQRSEYLNVIITIVTFLLAGQGMTFNSKLLGINIAEVDAWVIQLAVFALFLLVLKYIFKWLVGKFNCIKRKFFS
ncbi:hypothetical protein QUF74_17855 [Candidatus Halobeggiatoa sp. HSG11]|nr:hypothetical protein [Candidatus Halobeggiatoa sp. HSG11]